MADLHHDDFLGLPVAEAREVAERQGWTLVRHLAPGTLATMDFREDRLNLVTDEAGTVTEVRLG